MKRRRLTELLVGHALAGGGSVEDALRESRAPHAGAAAAEVQAGRLEAGLLLAKLPPEQARLARLWPAALRPAQRRLESFPSALVSLGPMLATFGYVLLIGLLQRLVFAQLDAKILPQLVGPASLVGDSDPLAWLPFAKAGLEVLLLVSFLGVVLLIFAPRRLPRWGRHRSHAREAAMAAALHETGAPAEVWLAHGSSLAVLRLEHASAAELDVARREALARAEAVARRGTAILRAVGLGALGVVALLTTHALYLWIVGMTDL